VTLRTLLRFQNPDSTQDINDRTRGLFNKGVFSGGDVEAISSTLTVRLTPFASLGPDGMFVREDDENNVLSVSAGVRNYIVVRQRYVANTDPIVSVESLTGAEYLGDPEQEYLITFAVVDVPALATEVLQSHIEFFERDVIDPVGRLAFRGVLDNAGLLPLITTNSNRAGDFYIITDGSGGFPEIWTWNGLEWVNTTQAQTMISLLDTHRDNLDVDKIHVTDLQADALFGTVGTPSDSNRYVTSLDPRIPSQNENDALQADPTILSEFAPSDSNRYINSSKIFAAPAVIDFVGTSSIELTDANGPYFVGAGTIGTAQKFFNIYGRDSSQEDDDQELLNSEFQPVRITGIFTEASLTNELSPAANPQTDALGFFSGASLFVGVSNPADVDFTISYGKRTLLGDIVPETFLLRGPQFGQVDARVRQILESSVNGQFDDSAWDSGTSPGDVVAFSVGLGKFAKHNLASSLYPVGIRGNTNNLIMEGLYEFTSAPGFSAGDEVYASSSTPGGLTTTPNDRFIGTMFDTTQLLVNMNGFAISPSAFVPGTAFPVGLFDGSLSPGEVAAFDGSLFVRWDDSNPATPTPDGLRGNSNNILQVGKFQPTSGSPYTPGTRFYASTTVDGQLQTGQNDYFVGHAVSSNELLVNVTASPMWETARSIFAIEHDDTTGTHSEGSARTFVGVAADAGIATSNSLASSTGMTLFATDTGQVFYCTNGAANTWVEASQFSGPLEITSSLEVGGNLILPTGILDDDAGDTFNVFTHALRHEAGGTDSLSGLINQILVDADDGSTPIALDASWTNVLSVAFDFTGRSGNSSVLCFAILGIESSGGTARADYRFTIDTVAFAAPFGVTCSAQVYTAPRESTFPLQGYQTTLSPGAHTITLQAYETDPSATATARHLLVLDLGPN